VPCIGTHPSQSAGQESSLTSPCDEATHVRVAFFRHVLRGWGRRHRSF